jgi:hypothetical protein
MTLPLTSLGGSGMTAGYGKFPSQGVAWDGGGAGVMRLKSVRPVAQSQELWAAANEIPRLTTDGIVPREAPIYS